MRKSLRGKIWAGGRSKPWREMRKADKVKLPTRRKAAPALPASDDQFLNDVGLSDWSK